VGYSQLVLRKQLRKRCILFWSRLVIASAWRHVPAGYVPGLINLSKLILCGAFETLVLIATKFNKLDVYVDFTTLVLGSIKFVELIV